MFPSLKIDYKTVHGSKGTEADCVIVIGLDTGKYGFPCQIEDDPVLNLVLAEKDAHPNAEERRLFYVAVTLIPGDDDDDDDDDDTGVVVIIILVVILACIGLGVVVMILIKKGIINLSKLKRDKSLL